MRGSQNGLSDNELLLKKERRLYFDSSKRKLELEKHMHLTFYVRAGKAYFEIYKHHYQQLKRMVLQDNCLSWFFLSGGYGIVNALEKAN